MFPTSHPKTIGVMINNGVMTFLPFGSVKCENKLFKNDQFIFMLISS